MSIGIALLGAGIFAMEHHLPAIKACPLLSLKAIYSRSQKTVESALQASNLSIDPFYDSPSSPSQSLSALLSRPDIHAVIIALPIPIQPSIIKLAMAAGKHILSEKPIAKDSQTARELISLYEREYATKLLWGIGENFRFWPAVTKAWEILHEEGGELVGFNVEFYHFVEEGDKYFQTEWRATPSYQGGFLLDGGIHFVAILRYLLQAVDQKIVHLSAFTSLLQERISPVDTIHSIIQTCSSSPTFPSPSSPSSKHRHGTFTLSFGTAHKSALDIILITDKLCITIHPTEVIVKRKEEEEVKIEVESSFGVREEVGVWAKGIEDWKERNGNGGVDKRICINETLGDLLVLEGMLRSGEEGGMGRGVEG